MNINYYTLKFDSGGKKKETEKKTKEKKRKQ